MNEAKINISVCGWKDAVPEGTLKLCVGSWAPVMNAPGWRDLWMLSPLSTVEGGVAVPGLAGVRSQTMENAWQFLKIWPGDGGWQRDVAMEAFRSTCAVRYPRGKGARAIGHHWGTDGGVLDYTTARKRIYVPAYAELLTVSDRRGLIERIRSAAETQPVAVWDPDSYDVRCAGMTDIAEAIDYEAKPFAHAFVVALAVQERLGLLGSGREAVVV